MLVVLKEWEAIERREREWKHVCSVSGLCASPGPETFELESTVILLSDSLNWNQSNISCRFEPLSILGFSVGTLNFQFKSDSFRSAILGFIFLSPKWSRLSRVLLLSYSYCCNTLPTKGKNRVVKWAKARKRVQRRRKCSQKNIARVKQECHVIGFSWVV